MIDQTTAPTTERIITCSQPGPRNNFGKRKLLAKITEDGLVCWCKTCQEGHYIKRQEIEQVWNEMKSSASITCPVTNLPLE